jgi:hypothetical protein
MYYECYLKTGFFTPCSISLLISLGDLDNGKHYSGPENNARVNILILAILSMTYVIVIRKHLFI